MAGDDPGDDEVGAISRSFDSFFCNHFEIGVRTHEKTVSCRSAEYARNIGDTIVNNTMFHKNRIHLCPELRGFNGSAAINAYINDHRSFFHFLYHLLGNKILRLSLFPSYGSDHHIS